MRAEQRTPETQWRVNLDGLLLQARTLRAIDIAGAHGAAITDFAPWSSSRRPTRVELLAGLEYLEEWEDDDPQLGAYGHRPSPDTAQPIRLAFSGSGLKHAERIQRLTGKLDALE